jgi:DNA-binding GntR family transcriptional regulator
MSDQKTLSNSPLLKEVAYEEIKELILNETFQPGSFLSERELISMLNMSKTPIKSALTRLEAEGFVTVSSKQGIIINDLSFSRIIDIYDLRTVLETHNVRSVLNRMTEEQFEMIRENLEVTEGIVKVLDVREFAKADHDFHLLISKFAGNEEIHRILLNYNDHLLRITLRHLKKDPNRMKDFYQDHLEIFNLLSEGREESVERMRDHLQNSKQKLFL